MHHFYWVFILLQSNVLEQRVDPLTDQHHPKMMSMIISHSVEVISRISRYLNLQDLTVAYPLILL